MKRNRFVQLTAGSRSINRDLEAKARALAGLKGYITNLEAPTPEYVMGAYHQRWQIETSFRMSKTDLRARQPADRTIHHLEHRPVREDPAPLPHRHHPGRRPDHHRRRPPPRRRTTSAHPPPRCRRRTLIGTSQVSDQGPGFAGQAARVLTAQRAAPRPCLHLCSRDRQAVPRAVEFGDYGDGRTQQRDLYSGIAGTVRNQVTNKQNSPGPSPT